MTRCPRCQRRFPPSGECPAHGRPTSVGDAQVLHDLPDVVAPEGWTLGRMIAIGGSAIVHELVGPSPAVLKWGRWRDRELCARFEIEAEVLRTVGAPSTPALIAHGTKDGWPYLVMENVGSETLASWMTRNGDRGSFGEIIAILTRISKALDAIHAAGYVHRDLKPENICVTKRGVRILDLGVAKPVRVESDETAENLTQIGAVVGTPHYMAPEQVRMATVIDHRADIYSLGVIAFEMFAGVPPFIGERRALEYQHQVGRPPSVAEHREVPPQVDELLARCLAKFPEARPASSAALRDELGLALTNAGTLRGMGGVAPSAPVPKPLGRDSDVALAWIIGGEPLAVTRAVGEVQGIVVSQRGEGILAAFAAPQHELPVAVALDVCRNLAGDRCRIAVHATSALVRRTKEGKVSVFGKDVQKVDAWAPPTPFVGLVLTRAAAERSKAPCVPAADVPDFHRERSVASGTPPGDGRPGLVGRVRLVSKICEDIASPILVAISGGEGSGKSRLLEEIAAKLQSTSQPVIHIRARERFFGDRPDDDRVVQALGGRDPAHALEVATAHRAVVLIDDLDRLSKGFVERFLAPMSLARVVTSSRPLVEGSDDDRVAIELPALSHDDAATLLREQLRPAHLIPDVLIERLALRGVGNPRTLLALARDMRERGGVRRSAGSNEWYVAADRLETLMPPSDASWLAQHVLDLVPADVAPALRMAAGLGPRFTADELAHVTESASVPQSLAFLQRRALVTERTGWYELESPSLREALYAHCFDERALVHSRALAFWLTRESANPVGRLARLAYHAAGSFEHDTAIPIWIALARAAHRRGEPELAESLLARAAAAMAPRLHPSLTDAIVAVDS